MSVAVANSYEDCIIEQLWEQYSDKDHDAWATLYRQTMKTLPGRMCDEYIQGLAKLGLPADRIVRFEDLSDVLRKKTGWEYVAVSGFLPTRQFFSLLADRKFPANRSIRNLDELEYQELPDIFHDVVGHAPLLMDPIMADFMQEFGKAGMACNSESKHTMLARLYWFTVEVGLIQSSGSLKAYGTAIASSAKELEFALHSHSPNRLHFDLERVFRTPFSMYDLQETYFAIDALSQMLELANDGFSCVLNAPEPLPDIERGSLVETDSVISVGDRSYHLAKLDVCA